MAAPTTPAGAARTPPAAPPAARGGLQGTIDRLDQSNQQTQRSVAELNTTIRGLPDQIATAIARATPPAPTTSSATPAAQSAGAMNSTAQPAFDWKPIAIGGSALIIALGLLEIFM